MAAKQETPTVRLRNSDTGAVVRVSEETAARLGAEWVSHEKKAAPAKKSAPADK